jgi:hypothetical protein
MPARGCATRSIPCVQAVITVADKPVAFLPKGMPCQVQKSGWRRRKRPFTPEPNHSRPRAPFFLKRNAGPAQSPILRPFCTVPFETIVPSTPIIATSSNPPDQRSQPKPTSVVWVSSRILTSRFVPGHANVTDQVVDGTPPFFFEEFS